MSESLNALKEWLRSKPSKIDWGSFLQMMVLAVRAIYDLENENAQLKAELNALSASLAVVENTNTAVLTRLANVETEISILKG